MFLKAFSGHFIRTNEPTLVAMAQESALQPSFLVGSIWCVDTGSYERAPHRPGPRQRWTSDIKGAGEIDFKVSTDGICFEH